MRALNSLHEGLFWRADIAKEALAERVAHARTKPPIAPKLSKHPLPARDCMSPVDGETSSSDVGREAACQEEHCAHDLLGFTAAA